MQKDIPEKLKQRYIWTKQHSARLEKPGIALEIFAHDRVGLMADIAAAASKRKSNLTFIQSWIEYDGLTHILAQIDGENDSSSLEHAIRNIPSVTQVTFRPTYGETYGKRVIILGGGAQVAQTASGAISEADRHNIRGEKISVDTIAIIGENEIAKAVRAVGRLHRAAVLVLAGSLMGGEITTAVKELRTHYGIPVISLKMAGSVNAVSDIVVTDPTEAGVMSVMLISHVGQFDLMELNKVVF